MPDGQCFVVDAAFYVPEKLAQLNDVHWITRVPVQLEDGVEEQVYGRDLILSLGSKVYLGKNSIRLVGVSQANRAIVIDLSHALDKTTVSCNY